MIDQVALKEIGTELRTHRMAAKLTLCQISKKLRIRKLYLQSIENANTKPLPSEAYTVGYIKHYAKFLGLNEKECIKRIKVSYKNPQSIASHNLITNKAFLPGKWVIYLSAALLLLLYLAVIIY